MFFCGSQTKSFNRAARAELRSKQKTMREGARGAHCLCPSPSVSFSSSVQFSRGCISYFANHKKKNTPKNPPTTQAKQLPSNLWLFSKLSPASPGTGHVRLSHENFSMSRQNRQFFSSLHSDFTSSINYGVLLLVDEDCRSVFVSLTCFQLCNRLVPLTYFDTAKFILH